MATAFEKLAAFKGGKPPLALIEEAIAQIVDEARVRVRDRSCPYIENVAIDTVIAQLDALESIALSLAGLWHLATDEEGE